MIDHLLKNHIFCLVYFQPGRVMDLKSITLLVEKSNKNLDIIMYGMEWPDYVSVSKININEFVSLQVTAWPQT